VREGSEARSGTPLAAVVQRRIRVRRLARIIAGIATCWIRILEFVRFDPTHDQPSRRVLTRRLLGIRRFVFAQRFAFEFNPISILVSARNMKSNPAAIVMCVPHNHLPMVMDSFPYRDLCKSRETWF